MTNIFMVAVGTFIVAVGTFIVVVINNLLIHSESKRHEERWELEDLRLRAKNLANKAYHSDRKKG